MPKKTMKPMSTISSLKPRMRKVRLRFGAVQQVVEDVGVDLDSHVTGALLLKRRVAQVADAQRGAADKNNFVAKGIRGHIPME